MKIELKNIKTLRSMSEETHCYSASLYVDGKKIGEVSNEGHGGPDRFHGDQRAYDEADAWVKANTPAEEFHGTTIQPDLEMLCGDLVNVHEVTKEVKSLIRRKVLMVEKDKPGVFETSFKGVKKIEDKHLDYCKKKYPDATILNTLPIEEAVKLFRANTGG